MARWIGEDHLAAVLAAADAWRERCFLADGSLLGDGRLWTLENIREIKRRVMGHPIEGTELNFFQKLETQLDGADSAVIQMMAEFIWFLLLFPDVKSVKPHTKLGRIREFWERSGVPLPESPYLSEQALMGVARPGTYFMVKRYEQVTFLFDMLEQWKMLPAARRTELMAEDAPWGFMAWLDGFNPAEKRPMRNVLLYFLFPDDLEHIAHTNRRKQIVKALKHRLPDEFQPPKGKLSLMDVDRAIYHLRQGFEAELGTRDLDFYHSPIHEQWVSDAGEEPRDDIDQRLKDVFGDDESRQRLKKGMSAAYGQTSQTPEGDEARVEDGGFEWSEPPEISPFPKLRGIDPSVYRQINAALKAGKQHVMFYGPPGTGKTTLAQLVAKELHSNYKMITGSADWTSQDVIGGYQPVGEGRVRFIPGVMLQNFDRPLIVDELNRCDIDKVIGPLFSVLSGQKTTLPYRTDIADEKSDGYVILPTPKPNPAAHEFAPKPGWRIIATINSIDKAALYQMSFALTRRFGWIYVDVPRDLEGFILASGSKEALTDSAPNPSATVPLATIWRAVNLARKIGPAPILDILKTIGALDESIDLTATPDGALRVAYLDGFYMYILPMLDGILQKQAQDIASEVYQALGLAENSDEVQTLRGRLDELAV